MTKKTIQYIDKQVERLIKEDNWLDYQIDKLKETISDQKRIINKQQKLIDHLTKGKDILVQVPYSTTISTTITREDFLKTSPYGKKYHFEELQSGIQFTLKRNSKGELELITPMTRLDLVKKAKAMIKKQEEI